MSLMTNTLKFLYESGCDDALVCVVNGQLTIDFDREASSLNEAISSASRDIEKAGGKVIDILPIDNQGPVARLGVAAFIAMPRFLNRRLSIQCL